MHKPVKLSDIIKQAETGPDLAQRLKKLPARQQPQLRQVPPRNDRRGITYTVNSNGLVVTLK